MRSRLLSAMGLTTLAATIEGCTPNGRGQPPADAAPPASASSPLSTAPSQARPSEPDAASETWSVSYEDPNSPERCRTRPAACFVGKPVVTNVDPSTPLPVHPASTEIPECAAAIDLPCICHRVEGCFKPTMCGAGLVAQVTHEQRAKKTGACCYAAPYECPRSGKGRTLRVDGFPRVAPPQKRSDWSISSLVFASWGEDTRAAALELWRDRAAGEHASIASFARVVLDLMALGAPPSLIARTHEAAIDEIRHAQIAYTIVSALAGEETGPGPLVTGTGARAPTFESFVRETFFDACVEETAGALSLQREAAATLEPVLAELVGEIASDEARHAELGWATLAWAVRAGGELARQSLRAAMLELDASGQDGSEHASFVQALVAPCVDALLSAEEPPIKA